MDCDLEKSRRSKWIKKGDRIDVLTGKMDMGHFPWASRTFRLLKLYIAQQKERHKRKSFEAELIEILREVSGSIRRALYLGLSAG